MTKKEKKAAYDKGRRGGSDKIGRPRQHPLVERICQQCKQPYIAPNYQRKKFCSPSCYKASFAPLMYVCESCGISFQREKRNDRSPRRFCSHRCVIDGVQPVRIRWKKARANGWVPKPKPVLHQCKVEGCTNPPQRIWHAKFRCWYGRLCSEHRREHRFAIHDQYDSIKKYGFELAPVHLALKQLKREMKEKKIAIRRKC
jgi:hypothetical protein